MASTSRSRRARAPRRRRSPSVALREAERLVGDEVEDHLAAHRRDAQQPHDAPQVGDAVLGGHAVAAERLDRRVEAVRGCLGGCVLRHVGGLARGGAVRRVVVEPRGALGHQPRKLELDLRGRRAGARCPGARRSGRRPRPAAPWRRRGDAEHVAPDAVAERRAHDPLGVEAVEDDAQPVALVAEQAVAPTSTSSKNREELLVGQRDLDGDERRREPRRVGVDDEEAEPAAAGLRVGPVLVTTRTRRLVDERR